MPDARPWIVAYIRGARIASSPMDGPHDWPEFQRRYYTRLIQRDANGTEHHEIIAPRPTRQNKKA